MTPSDDRLPPTAELVATLLEHEGPMSRSALLERTDRCETAVDSALNTLEKRGRLARARKSDDLRETVLSIRRETDA